MHIGAHGIGRGLIGRDAGVAQLGPCGYRVLLADPAGDHARPPAALRRDDGFGRRYRIAQNGGHMHSEDGLDLGRVEQGDERSPISVFVRLGTEVERVVRLMARGERRQRA